jgi:hypothetical protein
VKAKTTLVLLGVFAALLAVVLYFDSKVEKKSAAEEKTKALVDIAEDDLRKIEIARPDETLALERDEAGAWRLTSPLAAAADEYEAKALAGALAGLRLERVVEKEVEDPAAYGLPGTEVRLWAKGMDAPVKVHIGMENPLDKSLFAKREDDPRLVLLAATVRSQLDKKVLDLRQKDIFKFAVSDVRKIRVRAKDVAWEAARTESGWALTSPVAALAAKTKVDSLLDALSGLRAKDFAAEDKDAGVLEKFGLAKPEYEVALSLPAASQEIVFTLHKEGEAQYATTSLATKVVAFEGTVLTDLDRKVEELREKKVADFYAWDAHSVLVKRDGAEIAAVKVKSGDAETWYLDAAAKEEADRVKLEDFVRKVEGLEAAAFVDAPAPLGAYGLDPGTEVRVKTRDFQDKEKEVVLFIGREDAAKKQVAVKAAGLDYLFLVDSGFLADLPKAKADWKAAATAPPEGQGDKK